MCFRAMNGSADNSHWMLGATLNPSSNMAKEMNLALEDEKRTHAAYDPANDKQYLGVPFIGRRRVSFNFRKFQTFPASFFMTKTHFRDHHLAKLLTVQATFSAEENLSLKHWRNFWNASGSKGANS